MKNQENIHDEFTQKNPDEDLPSLDEWEADLRKNRENFANQVHLRDEEIFQQSKKDRENFNKNHKKMYGNFNENNHAQLSDIFDTVSTDEYITECSDHFTNFLEGSTDDYILSQTKKILNEKPEIENDIAKIYESLLFNKIWFGEKYEKIFDENFIVELRSILYLDVNKRGEKC